MTEQDKGLATLWYSSDNMQKHQPKPDGVSAGSFFLYIANPLNSTAGMNVVHNALYARNYAKYAALAGVSYTTYYTDYNAMTEEDKGSQRFSGSGRGGSMVMELSIELQLGDCWGCRNETSGCEHWRAADVRLPCDEQD